MYFEFLFGNEVKKIIMIKYLIDFKCAIDRSFLLSNWFLYFFILKNIKINMHKMSHKKYLIGWIFSCLFSSSFWVSFPTRIVAAYDSHH